MLVIASFSGILIGMDYNKQLPPHFYAAYSNSYGIYDLSSLVMLQGDLSTQVQELVLEWAKSNHSNLLQIWNSIRYFETLKQNAGITSDEWCIVCPYGIGDTYFVCALSEQILRYNGAKSIALIVKKSHIDIPQLFPRVISHVVAIENNEIDYFRNIAKFEPNGPTLGHPSYFRDGSLVATIGFKEINLLDLYKFIFRLPLDISLLKPNITDEIKNNAQQRFKAIGLPLGKTVIIAPDAISINQVNTVFWKLLTQKLRNLGWTVCSNVIPGKECLPGTIPITFPLMEAIPIAELAGWVISLRSGLCDLLSTANCKLSVIYPYQNWYYGTVFSGSSLKQMNLSSKVKEYEIKENDNFPLIIEKIIEE